MQSLLYVRGEIKALAGAIDVIADDVQAQKVKNTQLLWYGSAKGRGNVFYDITSLAVRDIVANSWIISFLMAFIVCFVILGSIQGEDRRGWLDSLMKTSPSKFAFLWNAWLWQTENVHLQPKLSESMWKLPRPRWSPSVSKAWCGHWVTLWRQRYPSTWLPWSWAVFRWSKLLVGWGYVYWQLFLSLLSLVRQFCWSLDLEMFLVCKRDLIFPGC